MTQGKSPDQHLNAIRAIEANIRANKLDDAATAIEALRLVAPTDVRVDLAASVLARAKNDVAAEISALQRAVKLTPRWPLPHLELAKAYSRTRRHVDALASVANALDLDPNSLPTLEIAVAVATEAGEPVVAERHLRAALALRDGDFGIRTALAMAMAKQERFDESETLWRELLAERPDDRFALGWLSACLIRLGRKDQAREVLEPAAALWPDDPSLSFHLAIARGETPRTHPKELTQQLFDDYATRFDQHLVGQLKYRVPKQVAAIITARSADRNFSLLDLGCGTGLLGAYLGRIGAAFVGVDVSLKMIEEAARHSVYTDLRQADLLDELRRAEADSFDYVVANDVFIYLGDLTEVIPAIFRVLRRSGAFIFSCETAQDDEGDLVLRPSKRYAHSRVSVSALCRDAGFADTAIQSVDLRLEGRDKVIAGFIAVAEKR